MNERPRPDGVYLTRILTTVHQVELVRGGKTVECAETTSKRQAAAVRKRLEQKAGSGVGSQ